MAAAGGSNVVRIIVAADVADALRGLTSVQNAAGGVGNAAAGAAQSTQSAWETLKNSVAGQVALGGLIEKSVSGAFGAVVDGAKQMVAAGMDYESSMNTLGAVTSASTAQMKLLGDRAKQLGNDITIPGASAGSAAAAMAELAKGGLEVDETMAAAAGTLRLAAAAGIDGADAAQIQANALNAFRLSADKADHVADLLANSANAASGEVTDMASALAQSATVAAGFGISIDDSATTLALFAKNGVLGSDAGTSFKTMLSSLASPSKEQAGALADLNLKVYDALGNFVGMESVTRQLAEAKKVLTVEEYNAAASTAFGTDAIRAANILGAEGVRGWDDMAAAVGKAGGAQEVAAAQSQGLTGAVDRFQNAAANTALVLFEKLSPAMQSITDFGASAFGWLGDAIGWMAELPTPVWAGVTALTAMVLLKGPLNALLLQGIAGYTRLALAARGATFSLAAVGAAAKTALAFVGGPIGLAVIGLTTALSFLSSSTDDAAVSTAGLSAAIDENTGALAVNADAIIAKAAADSGSFDAIEAIGGNVKDYTDALMGNADAQGRVHTLLLDQAEAAVKGSDGWAKMVGAGEAAEGAARKIASGLLASGDAGEYQSERLAAVMTASQNFAAESDMLETAQRQTSQAIEASGTAAGSAAGQVDKVALASQEAEEAATPFADALKALRGAASEADAATSFLTASLELLTDGSVSAETMQRSNEAAMRAVVASARDLAGAQQTAAEKQAYADKVAAALGTTLDGQAVSATNLAITQEDVDKATREAADAADAAKDAADRQHDSLGKLAENARQVIAKAYENKVAQGDMKGAVADATAVTEEQRKKFIDSVAQINGGNIPAAEELADKYGLIPKDVHTIITQEGIPTAISEVQRLRAAINDLPDSKIVSVQVESGDVVYTTSNGAKFKADGGPITGPGGPRDDRAGLFHLSAGEFVSTAATAAHPGNRAALDWMHAGGVFPGMKDGGPVDTNKITLQAAAGNLVDTGWLAGVEDQVKKSAKKIWDSVGFVGNGQWGPGNAGGLAANTAAARDFIMRRWGITNIGGWRASGSVPGSDHPMGKALDVMIGNYLSAAGIAQGTSVADWFTGNPNAFGTKYVIWRDRINQGGAWAPYSHPGGNNDTLAHRDHVHLSFLTGAGQFAGGGGGGLGDAPGGGVGAALGSGVERWRPTVLQALTRTGQAAAWANAVLKQMNSESGGNPQAINLTDSNARRGTPSKGLMQLIDPTFQRFRDPALTNDIWLPSSNVTAAIRYVLGTYPEGLARFNNARAYDNGGDLPPGFTMAYNGTGKTEHVFTRSQMIQQGFGGGAPQVVVNNYIDGTQLDSRVEMLIDGERVEYARLLERVGAQG